ncbi:transcriptional regulator [Cryobacterium sp. TMT2-17-1]|uniref:Transcriptional regulator n=1 Tax=Cryobacterium sandaracinum TaxID=1259247 RepID=A0ABY2JLT9_9MICO|nr:MULTISPECIES: Rrf2 family transcriptional regulator [Cryobacterium]TFC34972.1 transcriptional regulator [Cryobacterium sp. TMT2-14]TFC51429.1 transcriptional regulator [Cryobacterium sp. TMT2-17-1]TFC71633.1 transcriptional regulator [Cryobacterium sp. TMT2-4]TFD06829.1 transcriptional regulator [Cryobacterium sandaracinum]
MRINAFSDVSLRALMFLATLPDGELQTSRVIAEAVATPYSHVSKAVMRLRELGLVESLRGRTGGVRISPVGRTATVGWLLRQLDTRDDVADCETPHGDCPLSGGCGLRGGLRRAREAFYAELDDLVIAALPHIGFPAPVVLTLAPPPPRRADRG